MSTKKETQEERLERLHELRIKIGRLESLLVDALAKALQEALVGARGKAKKISPRLAEALTKRAQLKMEHHKLFLQALDTAAQHGTLPDICVASEELTKGTKVRILEAYCYAAKS